MLTFILKVKRALARQKGLKPDGIKNGEPWWKHVPDGDYKLLIDGKSVLLRVSGDAFYFPKK